MLPDTYTSEEVVEKKVAWETPRKSLLKRLFGVTCLTASLALISPSSDAAVIYSGPFVGSTVTYSNVIESSAFPADDPEPLFGPPTIATGNLLDFDPSINPFAAGSPPIDITDGSLTFTVSSNSSDEIVGLRFYENGDYNMAGLPSGTEQVSATVSVRIIDPTDSSEVLNASSSFIEEFDTPPFEGVFWENELIIDLRGLGLTEVEVILNNTLIALSESTEPVATFIRKKEFQVDVIPEPSSAILVAIGSALMACRRRRG